MTALLRLAALRERLRTSLWFMPSVAVSIALIVGVMLATLEARGTLGTSGIGFAGSPDGARAVLATVAGSMITVTGLTFSLTVVALQVAASQFTPRLLSTFLADRGNQAVLSVFLSTFVYSLAVLRSIRSATEGAGAFVPDIAVAVGLALTLLSVAMLVYFFHHLTEQLRVESVLADLGRDTLSLISGQTADELKDDVSIPAAPSGALVVRAKRSGYLQAVQLDVLLRIAMKHDVVVRLRPSVGMHVTVGTTIAWVWPVDGSESTGLDRDGDISSGVHHGIQLGRERTMQHDVAYGIRQLVDIIARAMSPGINDPTTAVAAIATTAPLLTRIARDGMRQYLRTDDEGRIRTVVPMPSFAELLGLACDQPRRYGAQEPAVLIELLRLLTDAAEAATRRDDHAAIRAEASRTVAVAEDSGMPEVDIARVRTAAAHAVAALSGGSRVSDVDGDRSETVAE